MTVILERNPELKINGAMNMDEVQSSKILSTSYRYNRLQRVLDAARVYASEQGLPNSTDAECVDQFLRAQPAMTNRYLARSVINCTAQWQKPNGNSISNNRNDHCDIS